MEVSRNNVSVFLQKLHVFKYGENYSAESEVYIRSVYWNGSYYVYGVWGKIALKSDLANYIEVRRFDRSGDEWGKITPAELQSITQFPDNKTVMYNCYASSGYQFGTLIMGKLAVAYGYAIFIGYYDGVLFFRCDNGAWYGVD